MESQVRLLLGLHMNLHLPLPWEFGLDLELYRHTCINGCFVPDKLMDPDVILVNRVDIFAKIGKSP